MSNRSVGLQGFATVGVTLPIFNRNQGNIEAAKAESERAEAEVSRVRLSLRQMAQPLVQTILSDQEQAARYKQEMLPRAAGGLDAARASGTSATNVNLPAGSGGAQ